MGTSLIITMETAKTNPPLTQQVMTSTPSNITTASKVNNNSMMFREAWKDVEAVWTHRQLPTHSSEHTPLNMQHDMCKDLSPFWGETNVNELKRCGWLYIPFCSLLTKWHISLYRQTQSENLDNICKLKGRAKAMWAFHFNIILKSVIYYMTVMV